MDVTGPVTPRRFFDILQYTALQLDKVVLLGQLWLYLRKSNGKKLLLHPKTSLNNHLMKRPSRR